MQAKGKERTERKRQQSITAKKTQKEKERIRLVADSHRERKKGATPTRKLTRLNVRRPSGNKKGKATTMSKRSPKRLKQSKVSPHSTAEEKYPRKRT